MDEESKRFCEEFLELLEKAQKLEDGDQIIEIEELLLFNESRSSLREVALIKDKLNRILAIPKDGGKERSDSLVSFEDMTKGMRLRLFVKRGKILRVLKIGA